MPKLCIACQKEINPRRLEIFPETRHCTEHSPTGRIAGHQVISGKNTYSEIQLVDQETAQELYRKGARKGQSPIAGIRMKGH